MSSRKQVYHIEKVAVDGGEHPNRFVPQVTAEVRIAFPPHTERMVVEDALREAYRRAVHDIWSTER